MNIITQEKISIFQKSTKNELNGELINACLKGYLDIIHYLLTSTELKEHADIHYNNDYCLIISSQGGLLDIVKYLLSSPELKEHCDIHAKKDLALRIACNKGYLDIVQYLLTSSELKEHASINTSGDIALIEACRYGHIDIVKYLLTSPDLKEYSDLYREGNDGYCGFRRACINEQSNIIHYLIFDYRIEKTEAIELFLIKNKKEYILNMFNRRELGIKLQTNLINDKNQMKIKI